MTDITEEEPELDHMMTPGEVLYIVIASGGQVVVDDNHRIDAIGKQLGKTFRKSTQETIYTAIPVISYGRCPHCGGNVVTRERRINGNDTCEDGHVYPSRCSR